MINFEKFPASSRIVIVQKAAPNAAIAWPR
jgi:hypothetical protein